MVDNTNPNNNIDQQHIDRLLQATAYDQSGDKIGKVGQVYLDDQTGRPTWATVSTGLFGGKETFVPLDDVQQDGEDVRVPYTKDFVKDAPRVDADGHISAEEERELYAYYSKDYSTTDADRRDGDVRDADRRDADVAPAAAGPRAGDRDVTDRDARRDVKDGDSVVRHEEQVNVDTERVDAGRMRLRKYVVTDQETVNVPVEREEAHVTREPIRDGEAVTGGKLGEEEVSVTLHEERPVVDKKVVAAERVGLDKEVVREDQSITTDVSREEVVVERDGDVTRDGDVNRNDRKN